MLNKVVRSLATVVVGVLLILLPGSAMDWIIRIVGAAFFLPAVISVVKLYTSRHSAATIQLVAISVIDVGSIAFGLWLMIAPATFAQLFVMLLGIALLLFSLFQLFVVFSTHKTTPLHWGFLIAPLLLAVAAVVILANPFDAVSAASVMLGICAVVTGLSDLVISIMVNRNNGSQIQKL